MNKYMDALWELKLRVDAYNEKDEKANAAFEVLKEAISLLDDKSAQPDISNVDFRRMVEFMKKHTEVQEHPDMFFYREYPERILIDLRYTVPSGSFSGESKSDAENNECYNLCKRMLGLPEYKG